MYWAAYATAQAPYLGLWQYRVPIMMQIFFPAIVCIGMFFCPESPRWLVEKGRVDDARKSLYFVRDGDEAEDELETITLAIEYEKASLQTKERWYTPCESGHLPKITVPLMQFRHHPV